MKNPYSSLLGDRNPLTVLTSTAGTLEALLAPVMGNRAALQRKPAPDKWCLQEILAHLTDCELAFGFRLRQCLAEPNHTVQPFDQDHWATHYDAYAGTQPLAAYLALRNWNLALIQSLTPADLDLKVNHPEQGEGTVREILNIWAGHDLNHLQRLPGQVGAATA